MDIKAYISRVFGHTIGNSLLQSFQILMNKSLVLKNHIVSRRERYVEAGGISLNNGSFRKWLSFERQRR